MRKFFVFGILMLMVMGVGVANAQVIRPHCHTIQEGVIVNSAGEVLETGYDEWGYNYQAHMFNGLYCDAYRDAAWCQDYRDDNLSMNWSDSWLSRKDCSGNLSLDRYWGYTSYIGSGAWLTNHMSGTYIDENTGENCHWNYNVAIVAAQTGAVLTDSVWYDKDGGVIGKEIWGQFAIVRQISNDSCTGQHGLEYKGAYPRLGHWEDPN